MDGDEQRMPAYKWPSQWVKQESFWREVGTRFLATVFAAGFAYIFALAAGYVGRPNILPLVIFYGLSALILTACVRLYFTGERLTRKRDKVFYWVSTLIYALMFPTLILGLILWLFY